MPEQTRYDILGTQIDSEETKFINLTAVTSLHSQGTDGEIIFDSDQQIIPGILDTTVSLAATASYVNPLSQSVSITGNLTVNGTAFLNRVIAVTSSYSSGSTIFGDALNDTHQFTGSVFITGSSFTWNSNTLIASNVTSSMSVLNAQTASFINGGTF